MWRALAQYARPAFFRNNSMLYMALLVGAFWISQIWFTLGAHKDSVHFYEFAPEYLAQAIAWQLRRQTTTPVSNAIPGMARGERHAASLLVLCIFALAVFGVFLGGAPLPGVCAYVALLVATGATNIPADKSTPAAIKAVIVIKSAPALLIVFMAPLRNYVLHLPVWIALPAAFAMMLAALAFILREKRPRADTQNSGRQGLSALFPRRFRLSTTGLPSALSMPFGYPGEIALRLATFLTGILVMIPNILLQASSNHAHFSAPKLAVVVLMGASPIAIAFGGMISTGWLFERNEWPALFATGLHGTREGFARTLTAAFTRRIAISALTNATIATGLSVAIGMVPLPQAASIWLAITSVVFGTAALPCLAVLRSSLGSSILVQLLRVVSIGIAAILAGLVLATPIAQSPILTLASRLACALVLLAGLAVLRVVPRRLAGLDWPLV